MEQGDILGHEFMGEVMEVGPEVKTSRRATGWSSPSPSPAATASSARASFGRCATTPTPTRGSPRRCTATPAPDSSAIRTCTAAMPADRRNTCACPSPTSARIKVPDGLAGRKGAVSLRHLSRPATWRRRTATSARGTRWLSGAAGRSDNSRSQRLPARRRAESSPSTASPSACAWPATRQRPTPSTYEEDDVMEALKDMTGGRGPDCLHRRRRHGGARQRQSTPATTR